MEQWQKYYYPGKDICIDETVIPYNGRLSFKIFLRDKPHRYGVLMYGLADSETSYILRVKIYAGRQEHDNNTSIANLVYYLLEGYLDKYHRLFIDNFYTTINLVRELYKRNTGCIGTLRSNRANDRGLDEGMKKTDVRFFVHNEHKEIVLTLWYDSTTVRALSNCIGLENIDKVYVNRSYSRTKTMPILFKDYNANAKGIDRANQIVQYYRYPHKNILWWMAVFNHVIQVSIHNAYVIYKNREGPQRKITKRKYFHLHIIKQFIKYKEGDSSEGIRADKKELRRLKRERKKLKRTKKHRYLHESRNNTINTTNEINSNDFTNIHNNYHFPRLIGNSYKERKGCKLVGCRKKTSYECADCSLENQSISLCVPHCFEKFHMIVIEIKNKTNNNNNNNNNINIT